MSQRPVAILTGPAPVASRSELPGGASPLPLLLERIASFVRDTREAVFVRQVDSVLFIRPDKTMGLNPSARQILFALYHGDPESPARALTELAGRLGTSPRRLIQDAWRLLEVVGALLNEDFAPRPMLRFGHFAPGRLGFPTLAEIALTYGCQNRCTFCYASSPFRRHEHRLMNTDEVRVVMGRIFSEAHVPSLSFTGGEATLRPDLPQLIRHGRQLGLRINLITNGLRLADEPYARLLVQAGLSSAQVSLEAGSAALHDAIVRRPGAFARTVEGVRTLVRLGIHVHTNTTLCSRNIDAASELVRFVARGLGLRTMSMNMVIRTGSALGQPTFDLTYTQVGRRLPDLLQTARDEGMRLVWYSPIPYCIFNPVLHGLGAKSCACISGLLSVDPAGNLLPCSSFADGLGSLLRQPYARLSRSRAAAYWRRRSYLPPVCRSCADADICGGGCPLYWDAAGSFEELPRPGAGDPGQRRRWERERRRGRSRGVPAPFPRTAAAVQEQAWDG